MDNPLPPRPVFCTCGHLFGHVERVGHVDVLVRPVRIGDGTIKHEIIRNARIVCPRCGAEREWNCSGHHMEILMQHIEERKAAH